MSKPFSSYRSFFLILFLIPSLSVADQDSLDLTMDVATQTADAAMARRELLDMGAKKAIEEFLKSEFGDEVIQRQRSIVDARIVKEFSKYVPSSKHLEFSTNLPAGFKSSVQVKLNRGDLLKRSFEVGLRRPSELEPIVLPLWIWVDEVKPSTYSWWTPMIGTESLWLGGLSGVWESTASSEFEKQGLQFLRPQHGKYSSAVPEIHRKMKLGPEDIEGLSKQWKAPMSLKGYVRIRSAEAVSDRFLIDVNWTVVFNRNGREVAEIDRVFETDAGVYPGVVEKKLKEIKDTLFADVAEQVGSTRRKGTLQAESMQIEFAGALTAPQRESLRNVLGQKFRGIKEVRESFIDATKTIFDLDVIQPLDELAKEMPDLPLSQMKVTLEKTEASRFVFKVSSKTEGAQ